MNIDLIEAAFFLIITFSFVTLFLIVRSMVLDQSFHSKNHNKPIELENKKSIPTAKYMPYQNRHKEL